MRTTIFVFSFFLNLNTCCCQLLADDKATILEQISAELTAKGYAATTTFRDIETKFAAKKNTLDESADQKSFVAIVNSIFADYNLSHLRLITSEELNDKKNFRQIGLGTLMRETEKGLFISSLISDGPAEKAGVQRGDYLIKVNDSPANWDLIEGKENETKCLTLLRNDDTVAITLTYFTHRPYSRDTLYWYNDTIAVIEIHSFTDLAYHKQKVEQLFTIAREAKGIILDIRGNRGGNSNNVGHLLNMFVPENTVGQFIVHREDYDRFLKKTKRVPESLSELAQYTNRTFIIGGASKSYETYAGNIYVMVDNNCGSGGEMFPCIVQDLKAGTVIGCTTIGKVLAGKFLELHTGMQLQYPTGEHIRLDGSRIEGKGCTPDILLTRDETANNDIIFRKLFPR